MLRNLLACRTALVFAVMTAATTARSEPQVELDALIFAPSRLETNPNQPIPNHWLADSVARRQPPNKRAGGMGTKPLFSLDLNDYPEKRGFEGKPERDVKIRRLNDVATPGNAPSSYERFPLGNYYVSPVTEPAIKTVRPLNNSDCLEDGCTETSSRPRIKSSQNAIRRMSKPYLGLSIIAPLE
jgi:hypothetical protein